MEPSEILDLIVQAYRSGSNGFLAAAITVAVVWAVRYLVAPKVPALKADWVGVVLAFLAAGAGSFVTAYVSGTGITAHVVLDSLKVAIAAMGSYVAIKKAFAPLFSKVPWMGRMFSVFDPKKRKAK